MSNKSTLSTMLISLATILAGCAATPAANSPTAALVARTQAPSATNAAVVQTPKPSAEPQPTVPAAPAATSAPPASGNEPAYLDDRSNGESLILSFYNAINRKEYARAYSYWQPGAAGLPTYDAFAQGYSRTSTVQAGLGTITGDTGAGQTRYTVPIRLTASTTAGEEYYVGCYQLHLASPAAQATLPFQPLAIESATVQTSSAPATAGALQQACPGQGSPVLPAATATDVIDSSVYLDNLSGPIDVVRSFYNAINRHEYLRAYSYWQDKKQLPALADFIQGYSTTTSVALVTGAVQSDAGAGQRYYRVPITITSQQNDGSRQTFAGCYTLHLAQPAIQATPFVPLGITAATIQQIGSGTDANAIMNQSCQASG